MSNEQRIEELKQKVIKINNISPSFCSAKWLQTTLNLQNGYNHSCHHPSPHKIQLSELQNPASLHNSSYKKEQRVKMLKGERPQECDYCWNVEDLDKSYFSDRHYKTADYWAWDRIDEVARSDPYADINPAYLEVSFSNVCNFKCSYCSPEVSSKWMEEIERHGPYPTINSNHNLDWLKQVGRFPYKHSDDNPYVNTFHKYFPTIIDDLRVFRITGGEPLLSKDVQKTLSYLIDNPKPNLELAINSNLCVDDKLIDNFIETINKLSNSVKRVDIYTSLESIGEQAEYSRYGLNHNKWIDNVRKILSNTNSTVSIMTTMNVLSLPTTTDFLDLVIELRKEFNLTSANNRVPVSINYLRWPPHLNVLILPKDLRKHFAKDILAKSELLLKYYIKAEHARLYLEEWDQIKRFCDYLTNNETRIDLQEDFVKFINEYDLRRGTDFISTFPQYENFWKELNA
jgi:MoaA/NifB/PqqE/SkfB family radical SAM enzyme